MRLAVVFVLLLLSSVAVPVQGQQAEPLAEDRSGDVISSAGAPNPSAMAEIDLVGLGAVETPRDILLILQVAELNEAADPEMLATAFAIGFQHNAAEFRVYAGRNNVFGGGQFFAMIGQVDPGTGRSNNLGMVDIDVDAEADTLTFTIPRALLRDDSGAPPFPGRTLDTFAVTSYANRLVNGNIQLGDVIVPDGHYADRMPNDGSAGPFNIQLGVQQLGHAALSSLEPFRASNGEATTYVFQVQAKNLGDEAAPFVFNATSIPASWDISMPEGDIEIEPGYTITIPVIVGTAFAHNHGSTESFIVEMKGVGAVKGTGRVEIGVHYPLIPQPAGHHDTLWVHAGSGEEDLVGTAIGTASGNQPGQWDAYVNALEDDERASNKPIPGYRCGLGVMGDGGPVSQSYCWILPLDPALQLGLDFDVSRTGTMDLTFASDIIAQGARVSAKVLYRPPQQQPFSSPQQGFVDDTIVLAAANMTSPQDINAATNVELVLVPTPDSDFIAYAAGASMSIEIRLVALHPSNPIFGPTTPAPTLAAGGVIQLPLNEYADPIVEIISLAPTGLLLSLNETQERFVNPGETVVYHATLENRGNATDISVDIVGVNREWAHVTGVREFRMQADSSRTFAIVVSAPADALDGEMADLVLEISNLQDVSDRILSRLVVTVDSVQDHEDEARIAQALSTVPDKKSPGAAYMIPLLVAFAFARRRSG